MSEQDLKKGELC